MPDCIFCRIVKGEIPASIVRRNDRILALRDVNPQAPVHVLIIPATHIGAARDARGPEGERLLGELIAFATLTATELGLDPKGYRLVLNTGDEGGQTVAHLHLHLLGGRQLMWPPG